MKREREEDKVLSNTIKMSCNKRIKDEEVQRETPEKAALWMSLYLTPPGPILNLRRWGIEGYHTI